MYLLQIAIFQLVEKVLELVQRTHRFYKKSGVYIPVLYKTGNNIGFGALYQNTENELMFYVRTTPISAGDYVTIFTDKALILNTMDK